MQDSPSQPNTPQAPSLSEQIQQYISTLPSILSAQQQYGPAFEQQNYDTQAKFAPMYKQLQDSLYPELAALTKNLTNTANQNISNGIPDAMRQQYLDQYRAEVGSNNGSGAAGDYISRQLINQDQAYKQQWANVGLSLIGQQPLYNAGQSSQSYNANSGYNAGSALNYGANTYGNYVGAYSNMYGTNANMYNSRLNLIGSGVGAAGTFAGGAFGSGGIWGQPIRR